MPLDKVFQLYALACAQFLKCQTSPSGRYGAKIKQLGDKDIRNGLNGYLAKKKLS